MRMDVERPRCARDPLVDAIALFLARDHAQGLGEIRIMLEQAIDEAGPGAVDRLGSRLASAGADWDYTPSDPLARSIHRVLASRVLQHEPVVTGLAHLEAVRGRPLVIFANHLSYSDANAVEVLLQRAGASDVADRLTVIAGPKVYSNVRRRFSSLCFGTIKVPQSTTRASEEAVMSARDVATAAKRSIQTAHERVRLGDVLLVFPEGSRSRSGRMQRLLPGAARYLELPDTWVVPIALTGTDHLFPLNEDSLNPVRLTLRIGTPLAAAELERTAGGDRQRLMDAVGYAIAQQLEPEYRGFYQDS
jgi:1-acyl-sn-glycerol-3-phosphate acyltransferase